MNYKTLVQLLLKCLLAQVLNYLLKVKNCEYPNVKLADMILTNLPTIPTNQTNTSFWLIHLLPESEIGSQSLNSSKFKKHQVDPAIKDTWLNRL